MTGVPSYMTVAALVTLITWVAMTLVALYSFRQVLRLEAIGAPRAADRPLPRLSVVVAARNEERGAEQSLQSLLALDYPDYEVIFVDDRSDDSTGQIADRLAARHDRLTVIHVRELPRGWFGKNHASHRGAQAASGELLLFTDGDVLFGREVVARGVRHLLRNRLDHLAAMPALTVRGPLLQACVIVLHWGAHVTGRLWKVRDAGSTASFGVGAYNLFRADSYHAIGGHKQVALRPDEDFQLGRLVKLSGKRSELVRAETGLRCEWYRSVRGLVRGMEKNLFAHTGYRITIVIGRTVGLLWTGVAPFVLGIALAPVDATAAALFAASGIVALGLGVHIALVSRFPWWTGLGLPLAAAVIFYSWWRSMILTLLRGLAWGGPSIPLSELRAARVRPVEDP